MDKSLFDLFAVFASIIGLAFSVVLLLITTLPLQIKESRVVNGLAALRRELLVLGISVMSAATIAMVVLLLSLLFDNIRVLLELLILLFTVVSLVTARSLYNIYHQQYTPEHKRLSRRIQQAIDKEDNG